MCRTLAWSICVGLMIFAQPATGFVSFVPSVRLRNNPQRQGICSVDYHSEGDPLQYVGPIGDRSKMEAGVEIGDIGLEVLVGPSMAAEGRGLTESSSASMSSLPCLELLVSAIPVQKYACWIVSPYIQFFFPFTLFSLFLGTCTYIPSCVGDT
jgi:hypothetical protein